MQKAAKTILTRLVALVPWFKATNSSLVPSMLSHWGNLGEPEKHSSSPIWVPLFFSNLAVDWLETTWKVTCGCCVNYRVHALQIPPKKVISITHSSSQRSSQQMTNPPIRLTPKIDRQANFRVHDLRHAAPSNKHKQELAPEETN